MKNPNFVHNHEKYGKVRSDIFKKGFLKAEVLLKERKVNVISMHGHPFHFFGENMDDYPEFLSEIKNYIISQGKTLPLIIGGDFNYSRVKENFVNVFNSGVKMGISDVITHKNAQYDHIMLTENFKVLNKDVDFCTDDHALIYVDVDIN